MTSLSIVYLSNNVIVTHRNTYFPWGNNNIVWKEDYLQCIIVCKEVVSVHCTVYQCQYFIVFPKKYNGRHICQYNDDDIMKYKYVFIVPHVPLVVLLIHIYTIFVTGQGSYTFNRWRGQCWRLYTWFVYKCRRSLYWYICRAPYVRAL